MDFYTPDAVAVSPVFGEVRGRAAIAQTWEQIFLTMPDARISISDVLKDGQRIALIATMSATDRVGWFGLQPTGGQITYRVIILLTCLDSKIVREERVYDLANVRQGLEKARIDAELNLAAEVQRALLPRNVYRMPYCEVAGASTPSRQIGGDFYQFIDLPNGEIGIALGDISGKGPAAAILAAMIQGVLAVGCRPAQDPSQTLAAVNAAIMALQLETRFVTMIYGILSAAGKFVYANAGHAQPFLITTGGLIRLAEGELVAGLFGDAVFPNHTVEMKTGECIVMFTDGVTDATNSTGENFGEDRLLGSLKACQDLQPSEVVQRLLARVHQFVGDTGPADDLTLLALKFSGVPR